MKNQIIHLGILVCIMCSYRVNADQNDDAWSTNGKPISMVKVEKLIKKSLMMSYSEEGLINFLKSDYNVTVKNGPNDTFNRPMLAFIVRFLQELDHSKSNSIITSLNPLEFVEDNRSGFYLVRRDANTIYFSNNSPVKLYESRIFQTAETLRNNASIFSDPGASHFNLGVTFNNELYFQLASLLYEQKQLDQVLFQKYGLSVLPETFGEHHEHQKQFSFKEKLTILKQLKDLPKVVLGKLKLNKLVRMRSGYDLGDKNVLAHYDQENLIIRFADKSFSNDKDLSGEGTMLHEIGHSYWFGQTELFRQNYNSFSWLNQSGLRDGEASNFVTPYSMKSPAEDFAEHFSYYVNKRNFILQKTKFKYDFLRMRVFNGIEFRPDAFKNFKLMLASDQLDVDAPYFVKNKVSSTEFVITPLPGGFSEIKIVLKGLRDDISGVGDINAWLKIEQGPGIVCNTSNCDIHLDDFTSTVEAPNTYRATRQVVNSWFVKGNYKISFGVGDKKGNNLFYSLPDNRKQFLVGTAQVNTDLSFVSKVTLSELISKTKLKSSAEMNHNNNANLPASEDTHFEITLPIEHNKYIGDVKLTWQAKANNFDFIHLINFQLRRENLFMQKIISKPGDKNLKIQLVIPHVYPSDKMELIGLAVDYDIYDKASKKQKIVFTFPEQSQRIYIDHTTSKGVTEQPIIDIDNIKFTSRKLKKKNWKGGAVNLVVEAPILNFTDHLETFYHVTITTPDGMELMNSGPKEEGPIGSGVDLGVRYTVKFKGDQVFLYTEIPLPPYHDAGTDSNPYILKGIKIRQDVADENDAVYGKGQNYPKSDNFHQVDVVIQQRAKALHMTIDPQLVED